MRLFAIAALVLLIPSELIAQTRTEDFTSSGWSYGPGTTAHWNTTEGVLELWPFDAPVIGYQDFGALLKGIAVEGDVAYLALSDYGLWTRDLSDPTAPVGLTGYGTPVFGADVVVDGNCAYLAGGGAGLIVMDVTNPSDLNILDITDTPGYANGVDVAGDLVFVADGINGLRVYDVSDPTTPIILGVYDTPGSALQVDVGGNVALVADRSGGVIAVDVSVPTAPAFLAQYTTPDFANDVVRAGRFAYIAADGSGLLIVDFTDPTSPGLAGSVAVPGSAQGVTVAGDRAYVAGMAGGLSIVDISNKSAPQVLTTRDTPGNAYAVELDGQLAWIADYNSGLRGVRIAHAVDPVLVGTYDPGVGGYAECVAVSGTTALVTFGSDGVHLIDISDPESPSYLSTYYTYSSVIAVDGELLYVGRTDGSVDIVDISEPASPTHLSFYDTDYGIVDLDPHGDVLFATDNDGTVHSIDVTNPSAPATLDTWAFPGTTGVCAVAGNDLYAASFSSASIYVLDISDPGNVVTVSTFGLGSDAIDLVVTGDRLFVLTELGLRTYDIGGSPVDLEDLISNTGLGRSLAVSGEMIFIATSSGLDQIEYGFPLDGKPRSSFTDDAGALWSVVANGSHVYAANRDVGLRVLRVRQDEVDEANALAQSLAHNSFGAPVVKARMQTSQTAGVQWWVSGYVDDHWQSIVPDNQWNTIAEVGNNLYWKAQLEWTPNGNPEVDWVTSDWLLEAPQITAVQDVPNDQGRQVRLEWRRSGYDFVGETNQIVEYAVYRNIDRDLEAEEGAAREAYWDYVLSVPVVTEDDYAVVVSTLADSTVTDGMYWSTFQVLAMTATPGLYYRSWAASGYSLDNLAPGAPQGIIAEYATSGVVLDWDEAEDEDFQYFRIYRSTNPGFVPSEENLVQSTPGSGWTDPTSNPWDFFYKLTAVDHAGNESPVGEAATITGSPPAPRPSRFALFAARPNPFNPRTTIRFELAEPRHVRLAVYDLSGRLVSTLVDEERGPGAHDVEWAGRDLAGRAVASGVYLYRVRAGDFVDTKRMVLLK